MTTDSGTYDDATRDRRKMAAALLGQTLKPEENVKHWAQGLANLAKAGIGGYMGHQANEEAKAERLQGQADLYTALGLPAPAAPAESPGMFSKIGALLSGGGPEVAPAAPAGPVAAPAGLPSDQASYAPPPPAAPAATTFRPGITAPAAPAGTAGIASASPGAPDYSKAIAGIESGGAYDKLGPQTKTGDRAYGKYQVMGNNIPEWTTQVLGKPMTPEQFLSNPDAQEAVFKAKFGDYVQKYGPEGAAKAWFAGEKGMNNPAAKDVLGTTVAGYGQKFTQALGPQAAPQVAAALTTPTGDAVLPPGATPAQGALPTAEAVKGTSGVLADVPQDKKLQIAQMLSSKNPTVKAMGSAIMQQAIKPETTDEIKEYNLAKKQGFAGSFFDFKTGLKKAGAINVVQNAAKPELAFDTKAGELQAKRFDELAADGQTAKQMVSDITTLTDLGKNIGTGKSAEFKAAIGPYAETLGIKIDGLSDIQAYEAVVNRLAPNLRVKGSGAQSDLELKNFLKSLPSLGNTPEGNEIASTVLIGLQENKIRAAEIGSKALTKEINRSDAEKQLRDLPDPMTKYRDYMKANRGAPTAAGAAKAPVQGQTATNPKTGEKIMLKDGQWVPVQ
jgi:hypothetical protein